VKRSFESAMKIARRMESHPKIERVLFPWLPSFPQYELAQRQMSGCGGLITVFLKTGSIEKVEAFFKKLDRFLFAVSWGGHESLVMPMAAFYNISGRDHPPYPFTLVRFYIGLEDPAWLLEDLEQALEAI
jgi:cystathionine beta-lyase/cystathionine gamma-synthase